MKKQLIFATQVISSNLKKEIEIIDDKLDSYPNISIDTEFKCFKRVLTLDDPELEIYEDLKYNISYTNLREIGITVSDNDGVVGGTWRFDFIPSKKAGIAVRDCIPFDVFSDEFKNLLSKFHGKVKWFTFSGYIDIALLVALLTKKPLPKLIKRLQMDEDNEDGFVELVQRLFGRVYDLKVIAKSYENFGENKYLGLQKLADMIGVKRVGRKHDGASDSLLTAGIFAKFMGYKWISDANEGFLYLLSHKICYDPRINQVKEDNSALEHMEKTTCEEIFDSAVEHKDSQQHKKRSGKRVRQPVNGQNSPPLRQGTGYYGGPNQAPCMNHVAASAYPAGPRNHGEKAYSDYARHLPQCDPGWNSQLQPCQQYSQPMVMNMGARILTGSYVPYGPCAPLYCRVIRSPNQAQLMIPNVFMPRMLQQVGVV